MSVIKKSAVFAAMFLGLCAGSARAQSILTVKVPFPFVVNQTEFPAGQYDIRTVEDAWRVVEIQGMNNKSAAFVFTSAAGGDDPAGDQPSLVFDHSENQYRLSEIWESRTEGRELAGSSHHEHVARSETGPGPSQVLAYVLNASWK